MTRFEFNGVLSEECLHVRLLGDLLMIPDNGHTVFAGQRSGLQDPVVQPVIELFDVRWGEVCRIWSQLWRLVVDNMAH